MIDLILRRLKPDLLLAGALDETAHLATTLLVCGQADQRHPPIVAAGVSVGSVLIDIDHIPLVLLNHPLESAEDRPVTHSMLTLLMTAFLARSTEPRIRLALNSLLMGTLCHFIRDLATGGIPMFWPASRTLIKVPYVAYVGLIGGLVLRARSNAGAKASITHSIPQRGRRV
jgi:membrane-bound metal-dependent hydrolase YbcI (DUF457 family)